MLRGWDAAISSRLSGLKVTDVGSLGSAGALKELRGLKLAY